MSNNPSRKISRHQQAARRQQRPKGNLTPWLVAVGVAAVLVLAIVAGVLASGDGDDAVESGADGGAPAGFAELLGEPLPPYPRDGSTDPAIGATAPGIRGTTYDGVDTTVPSDAGPRIMTFLAHWCPHCQAELPVIVDWLAAGGLPAEVDLVAVSTAFAPERGNWPPEDWFAREGYPLPVIADNAEFVLNNGYGVPVYPFFAVVDGDGQIVLRTSGEKTPEELDQLVAAALS